MVNVRRNWRTIAHIMIIMYLCVLTWRPLLQYSIGGIAVDSVLLGWLYFFTILVILLYRRSHKPACKGKDIFI